ncbi:MAG: slipin family protein [Armatimonadota bacterium]|jgi:regulator of protease activity HflC (stomatin/prohibitin superfamily)
MVELIEMLGWFWVIVILFAVFVLPSAIKVVREYERGVIFRLGRLVGARGPGLFFIIPVIEQMIKVDLRVVTMDVAKQETMTRDNVPVSVDAVVYFQVVNPEMAINNVENFVKATSLISQTTLRSIVGQFELDSLLSDRDTVNQRLQAIIDEQTEPWGVKVITVEVRDVVLPEAMRRAMARQAETERDRRAKIINAEGEFQAAEKLSEAARIISQTPQALQLRFLQTLTEVAAENNSTIVFPVPVDLFEPFIKKLSGQSQN